MGTQRCATCDTEIIPGTNFCRACGAAVESSTEPSEMQTAVLDEKVARPTTQRLDPRTTTETSDAAAVRTYQPRPALVTPAQTSPAPASRRRLIVIVLILLFLLGGGALIGVRRARQSGNKVLVDQRYTYPGSHTVVNIGDRGGGVLQMETSDRVDKVSQWYLSNFKPSKTIQMTPAAVIIKDDTVTVTLVGSNEGTSIVIKQVAP